MLRSRLSMFSQTKFRNCVAHSYAFTLTEVIIVLVILGALALILIPNIANMMPDDHNIKYKKAFYTIQEIVSDIINDPSVCSGLDAAGNPVADNIFMTSCTGNLRTAFIDRANLVDPNDNDADIQTTDGLRWDVEWRDFNDAFFTMGNNPMTITVNVDNKVPAPANPMDIAADIKNGTFTIYVYPNGKVTTGTQRGERNLLLNNPSI